MSVPPNTHVNSADIALIESALALPWPNSITRQVWTDWREWLRGSSLRVLTAWKRERLKRSVGTAGKGAGR